MAFRCVRSAGPGSSPARARPTSHRLPSAAPALAQTASGTGCLDRQGSPELAFPSMDWRSFLKRAAIASLLPAGKVLASPAPARARVVLVKTGDRAGGVARAIDFCSVSPASTVRRCFSRRTTTAATRPGLDASGGARRLARRPAKEGSRPGDLGRAQRDGRHPSRPADPRSIRHHRSVRGEGARPRRASRRRLGSGSGLRRRTGSAVSPSPGRCSPPARWSRPAVQDPPLRRPLHSVVEELRGPGGEDRPWRCLQLHAPGASCSPSQADR